MQTSIYQLLGFSATITKMERNTEIKDFCVCVCEEMSFRAEATPLCSILHIGVCMNL